MVPKGSSINYALIWKKQELYPSFVRQVEIVSQVADAFLMDSKGVIVRDYARDSKTWNQFREVPIELTTEFLNDLVPIEEVKHDAREANDGCHAIRSLP